MSLDTGMPVQRSTIRAISSSVTLSRSKLSSLDWAARLSCSSSCFFSSGMAPYWSWAAFSRSYSRWAFSSWALAASSSSRSFCTLPMASFSFSHLALPALNWSRSPASSR